MMIQDINIENIVVLLKELPNTKKYRTPTIAIARGLNSCKGSLYQRLKRIIQWQKR